MYLHLNQAASASATKRPSAQRHEEMCDIPKARGAEARRESEVGGPKGAISRKPAAQRHEESPKLADPMIECVDATEASPNAKPKKSTRPKSKGATKKEGSARIEANAANACECERSGAAFRIEGPPVTDSVDTFL